MSAGRIGLTREDLGPIPDEAVLNPAAARLDPRAWFAHPGRPFELEIGSGKGTFLIQQAALEPEANFLGVEWAREFWLYAADRVRRRGMENIRLLNDDATEFLRWRCPDGIARVIHLYFSDPWPKRRHHRRRVVQDRFLEDAWRILRARGELRIVTDHDGYWAWMQEHFDRWTAPPAHGPAPGVPAWIAERCAGLPPFERFPFDRPLSAGEDEVVGTNFERKYRREGRPFHAAVLRRSL